MHDAAHVFVGLSGGVDSSVAAARLLCAGYRVTGVFIKVWQPDFLRCDWEAERLDAMRVAATLGIPFLTCDATERYKADVVDYLVREYRAGRTPNPDTMCNRHVKFGAFLEFADAHGADRIATGHYAQRFDTDGTSALYRGADTEKDQSYFLSLLTSTQLSRALFPVGDSSKAVIRTEAAEYGLPTAEKPDSQGVCFLGALDMKEFLTHFMPQTPGVVQDERGEVLGAHDGVYFYTIGQRHGFRITASDARTEPHYVVAKDIERNTLTVSTEKSRTEPGRASDTILLADTNWLVDALPDEVLVQTRYRQAPVPARVTRGEKSSAKIHLSAPLELPATGQICAVYEGSRCLGGGTIVGG